MEYRQRFVFIALSTPLPILPQGQGKKKEFSTANRGRKSMNQIGKNWPLFSPEKLLPILIGNKILFPVPRKSVLNSLVEVPIRMAARTFSGKVQMKNKLRWKGFQDG